MSLRQRVAATMSVLAAGLVLAVPMASAAEVGVATDLTWGVSRSDMDRTVDLTANTGFKWVRQSISWANGEYDGKGQYNSWWFAEWDAAIDKARARGLQVVLIIDSAPCWASADPDKQCTGAWNEYRWNRQWKPERMQDYADFVSYVVNRYKDKGVHHYEIWNEPNHPDFWASGPDAAEYVPMLRAGHQAVKEADPSATVLMGGLSSNDWRYLGHLYDAGGGAYFDVVNVHPYTLAADPDACWNEPGTTRKAGGAFCGIEEIRAVADQRGDRDKPVWITEFGWSSGTCSWCVSEAQQADYLVRAMRKVDENYPWVGVQMIYHLRNEPWLGEDPGNWFANLGLLNIDFSPKPAYEAVASYIATAADNPVDTVPEQPAVSPPPAPEPIASPPADGGARDPDPAPEPAQNQEPGPALGPAPTPHEAESRSPAKLKVQRAGVRDGRLDVLVNITGLADGELQVEYHAAGEKTQLSVPIEGRYVRIDEPLPEAQRSRSTGIVTLSYSGNQRVRPDEVRVRAARGKARLERDTVAIEDGRLEVSGSISDRARGLVRLRLGYVDEAGELEFFNARAEIDDGRWKVDEALPPAAASAGGQLSIQFTGLLSARMRGEQDSKQVLPSDR